MTASVRRYRLQAHLVAAAVCLSVAAIQHLASAGRTQRATDEWVSLRDRQQQLIDQSELLGRRRSELQTEELRLRSLVAGLRKQIPLSSDEQSFLEQLAEKAQAGGLLIQEFQPAAATRLGQFERIPIQITALCTWSDLCSFLMSSANAERICSVEECRIEPASGTENQLRVQLMIAVFSAPATELAVRTESRIQ